MRRYLWATCIAAVLAVPYANAADPILNDGPDLPPVPQLDATGIWGSLAISEPDLKHGIFWGANTRHEAEDLAFRHCQNAGGGNCKTIETFRNHRHWHDDDGLFPYNQCVVLAVDRQSRVWGSSTATSTAQARKDALSKCGVNSCEIVEQGCT